jgi:hypothetical protein
MEWELLLLIFDPTKLKKRKKNKKKIQEDTHEENLKDCPCWWWKTKMISGKVEGPECIRLTKLDIQSWLMKDPFSENILIWGKEIQFEWVRTL